MARTESEESIAYCHACGSAMNVAAVAPFSNVECPTCGKHTRVKREFGPYTLVRRHAVGGMSMVFVAQDNTLDREVALKILSEEFSADERRITAFEEEARITASFSHPHVVRVLRTGKSFGRFYIAMELVPGGHFEHQIRERGRIPEVEMLPLAIEVAQGLKAAHSAGLIHRDVKPGNILLDAEGHAKLVDFGLALVTQGGKAQAAEVWATPYYVPPETIEGDPEDFRSDIYAFGATLYHALSGVPSCGEETMSTEILREAKKKVIPLGTADPSLTAGTCAVVERAMAYSPEDRFSSYDEMIQQLETALKRARSGAAGISETSGNAARRRVRTKQAEIFTLVAAGLVLTAAVAGGLWWVTRREPVREIKPPVALNNGPIIPEVDSAAATGVARSYREARAAVESGDFEKAAAEFAKLRENPAVQEPTRSWAGVEAVAANYLNGRPDDARAQARSTVEHVLSVSEAKRIGGSLVEVLRDLSPLPAILLKVTDPSGNDAAQVMGWMLAGLKNWEQGMPAEAGDCFTAVTAAKIPEENAWLRLYQKLARDYLADREALAAPVFEKLPPDVAGCEAAVAELDQVIAKLKTRGRARFNVRAWQLDLAKHAKLLASPKAVPEVAELPVWDLAAMLAKLDALAKECRFTEAAALLKSVEADTDDTTRASLIAVTDAAGVFLTDLQADLAVEPKSGDFNLKSGEVVNHLAIDPAGQITATSPTGEKRFVTWADFSPDALIGLHRIFVKNPKSEPERLRRHEAAISYDWLAGNRERALAAASALAQGSDAFKQRWETISKGLPR